MARRASVERLFRKLEDRAPILRGHFDPCEATHREIDLAKTQFQTQFLLPDRGRQNLPWSASRAKGSNPGTATLRYIFLLLRH
jgi:hypothetical protein